MDLPPIGQPPEENCYDCFYSCKAAVRIKVGLVGLESVVWLGLAFGIFLRLGQGYTSGYSILHNTNSEICVVLLSGQS